jgi:hypothetical protein
MMETCQVCFVVQLTVKKGKKWRENPGHTPRIDCGAFDRLPRSCIFL